jgi:hypothetical protein
MIDCPSGSYPIGIDQNGNVEGCIILEKPQVYYSVGNEGDVILLPIILCLITITLFKVRKYERGFASRRNSSY